MTHDTVCDTENSFEFARKSTFALEVYQYIVTFVLIVDRICELALAPFACLKNLAVLCDESSELLNKCLGSFLGKIGVDNKKGFISVCDLFHVFIPPYGLQTVA